MHQKNLKFHAFFLNRNHHNLLFTSLHLFSLLLLGRVLAVAGQRVHLRTMNEHLLSLAHVGLRPSPGLLGGGLQGTAVRERERPGQRAHGVHDTQVQGRLLLALAARQKNDASNLMN